MGEWTFGTFITLIVILACLAGAIMMYRKNAEKSRK